MSYFLFLSMKHFIYAHNIFGEYMNTLWNKRTISFPKLESDIQTEILVVGGGICGLLTAYRLMKSNHQVVVVEADEIGSHRTGKSTACITALQDVYYADLMKSIGYHKTKLFLEANLSAVEEYRKLQNEFSFDFEDVSSYKYSQDLEKLQEEFLALAKLGYHAHLINHLHYLHQSGEALIFDHQGQMNPIKLIDALASKLTIYEHSKVNQIKNNIAYIGKYQIRAKKIVIATGYPFFRWRGGFYMKLTQNKSFVIALRKEVNVPTNAVGGKANDLYFRTYKDFLLVGGNDMATGKITDFYKPLEAFASSYAANSLTEYKWVNQDCVSLDGMPYIGRYRFLKNVYVATGFNLWGMTGSMLSSMVITDLIDGKENRYAKLFSPYRMMLFVPLLKNLGTAIFNLVKFKKPRCTHLGCALVWNKEEQCYECPCHGSKYDKDGNPLETPAIEHLKH